MGHGPLEIVLSDAHRAEVARAVAALRRRGTPLLDVTAEQFLLPTLAPLMHECVARVRDGRGAAVLRGLSFPGESVHDQRLVLWMLGLQLGIAASQSPSGHLVREADACASNSVFHTDGSDLTAFLARTSTDLEVVGSEDVVRALGERRPDLVARLFSPTHLVEVPGGSRRLPLACVVAGRLGLRYSRADLEGARGQARTSTSPRPDIELLDLLDELATSEERRHSVQLAPGDVALVDNYATLHTPPRGRALRVWLSLHEGRELPADFTWTTAGHRGARARGGVQPHDLVPA